ncbi:MAG: hypothetical protein Q8O42_09485 [Acidobacteriota bacterium]|nr:hypothetical protein [Acidobacteriota bacterium]
MARQPPFTTLHNEGTAREFIRIELVVRRPWSLLDMEHKLVIRASQHTGVVTATLERSRSR